MGYDKNSLITISGQQNYRAEAHMINFSHLQLKQSTLNELKKLQINFAFQPIYDLETEEIIAYEALMRPDGETPLELIDRYEANHQLRIIELATFFGATMAYYERGYQEKLCVNSFPSEVFRPEEAKVYFDYFPNDVNKRLVVEMLEYPRFSPLNWHLKQMQIKKKGIEVALDDFGTGYNDYSSLSLIACLSSLVIYSPFSISFLTALSIGSFP